jgi:CheY-like chemotaxis protein
VLLVDDDPALLETGAHILARLGYTVTCEEKGAKALELVEKDPELFDLVITDQTMPGMTGMELAKKVLAINPDIPIILCTGFSLTVDAESAKNAGIRGFMMKPLTKTEIARAVRDVLEPASAESVAGRAMQG